MALTSCLEAVTHRLVSNVPAGTHEHHSSAEARALKKMQGRLDEVCALAAAQRVDTEEVDALRITVVELRHLLADMSAMLPGESMHQLALPYTPIAQSTWAALPASKRRGIQRTVDDEAEIRRRMQAYITEADHVQLSVPIKPFEVAGAFEGEEEDLRAGAPNYTPATIPRDVVR